MKNTILIFLLAFLFSCENETNKSNVEEEIIAEPEMVNEVEQKSEAVITGEAPINQEKKDFLGYYVGAFKAVEFINEKGTSFTNKINISIDSLNEESKQIYGHSVVAGNIRPFSGNYDIDEDKNIKAKVNEPGDDKYDGVFIFTINPGYKSIEGEWIANDKNLSVTKRRFDLNHKTFVYNPKNNVEIADWGDALYDNQWDEGGEVEPLTSAISENNASIKKLKGEDLENLYKADLEVIRNLIYARHGYSFKNRRMRYFFDSYIDWYIPVSTDVREELTDLEEENIALIKRYEEHAEKYYDYFGR